MAVGGGGDHPGAGGRRQVPHEYDVLDPAGVEQAQPAGLVGPRPEQAGRRGVADEQRGEDELEFVGEALVQELGVDSAAALDHQAADAAHVVQVLQQGPPVQGGTERDDVGGAPEEAGGPLGAPVGGVDDLVAAGVPEVGPGIEVAGGGDRDLQRVLRFALRHPGRAPLGGVDQQAGVVGADRAGADEDRVDRGPYRVDPVEVGRAGQQQALGAGVVQVAVEGDGGGQQHVRQGHRRPLFRRRTGWSGTDGFVRTGPAWFKF